MCVTHRLTISITLSGSVIIRFGQLNHVPLPSMAKKQGSRYQFYPLGGATVGIKTTKPNRVTANQSSPSSFECPGQACNNEHQSSELSFMDLNSKSLPKVSKNQNPVGSGRHQRASPSVGSTHL